MEIKCDNCNSTFELTEEQKKEVAIAANSGSPYLIVRCPMCHSMVILHPLVLMGITKDVPKIEDHRFCYCPTPQCVGFVEYGNENNIYECVECGSSWKSKKELNNDISDIVKNFLTERVYI
jgi:DNA-directed RNA polymerase subunit RPC12/RpoP